MRENVLLLKYSEHITSISHSLSQKSRFGCRSCVRSRRRLETLTRSGTRHHPPHPHPRPRAGPGTAASAPPPPPPSPAASRPGPVLISCYYYQIIINYCPFIPFIAKIVQLYLLTLEEDGHRQDPKSPGSNSLSSREGVCCSAAEDG